MHTKAVRLIAIKKVGNYGKIAYIPVYIKHIFENGWWQDAYLPLILPPGFAPGWWKGAWHNAPLNTLLVDTYNHTFPAFFSKHEKNDLGYTVLAQT